MRVAIFGTGYVGLVTGTCLAEVGHDVVCVDIDASKVEGLKQGVIPIYEPGLEPMVKENHAAGRLGFTTDAAQAIVHGEVVFIAVGTPPDEDGSADLQYVLTVARTIGRHIDKPTIVVNKSTVPVGTADMVRAAIAAELAARGVDVHFDVISNPEFLKEGDAVNDCMRPDRIVIGADNPAAVETLKRELIPRALLITPNLHEAAALLDADIAQDEDEMRAQAQALLAIGANAVLIKGGHAQSADATDLLVTPSAVARFTAEKIDTKNTHGTGCTLSSAIAAGLAKGRTLAEAVADAKVYVTAAIAAADELDIGRGHGPVHHFHAWW